MVADNCYDYFFIVSLRIEINDVKNGCIFNSPTMFFKKSVFEKIG